MRLVEQPMPQSYHLQDNDWTPLSQNPCWNRRYSPWPMFVYNDNLRVNIICKQNFYVGQVKSFVDDLNETGYCKHESSLCATICWGSALVSAICARTYTHSTTCCCCCCCCLFLPFLLPPPKRKHRTLTTNTHQSHHVSSINSPISTCCVRKDWIDSRMLSHSPNPLHLHPHSPLWEWGMVFVGSRVANFPPHEETSGSFNLDLKNCLFYFTMRDLPGLSLWIWRTAFLFSHERSSGSCTVKWNGMEWNGMECSIHRWNLMTWITFIPVFSSSVFFIILTNSPAAPLS